MSKASDVGIVVASGEVVGVAIGIQLFAGELVGVIVCACLKANSTEDVVLVPDKNIPVVIG